jgi:hypothetical protein
MNDMSRKLALLLLFAGFCSGQSLTPDEAIDRYLTVSRDRQPGCSDWGVCDPNRRLTAQA